MTGMNHRDRTSQDPLRLAEPGAKRMTVSKQHKVSAKRAEMHRSVTHTSTYRMGDGMFKIEKCCS